MNKTIIGMLHLLPLPGSPNYSGDFNEILDRAKQELENLLEGGISTVNIENYGDVPFSKNPAKPITVSAFTKIVSKLESDFDFDFALRQGARSRIRNWYRFSWIFDFGFDPALRPGQDAAQNHRCRPNL